MNTSTRNPQTALTKAQLLKRVEELEAQLSGSYPTEDVDIRPDEYIQIMSMISWPLNLSTGQAGRRPYQFTRMFEIKRVMYKDLVEILETVPTFAESGLFIILDKRVVRKHGLEEAYERILDDEKLNIILSDEFSVSYPVFKNANERQQKIIANLIISRMVSGEQFDMNLIYSISKDTGIDIVEKVNNSKALTSSK